jgi:COP9 signalosome complex subunit 3
MSQLEKIISFIIQTKPDEKELGHLQSELSKTQIVDFLEKNRQSLEGVLGALDTHEHTLGLIHLLSAIISFPKFNKPVFINYAQDLISKGSIKQIRLDPKRFSNICKKFVEACKEVGNPMRAVKPMKSAINKIAPPDHLTPQHAHFARACISAKCYKAALPILDKFVYLVDPKISGIKSEDTRLYYYYGGICYIALKQWEKAIEFFETVIAAPAVMTSAIMVEAYRKLILVSLIHRGEVGNLPKYTNQSVTRVIKQICTPYEELALAFSLGSFEDLNKAIENNLEPFLKDNNLGLVGQVKTALTDQAIKKLTSTYSTITFSGLLENTGLVEQSETELKILKMVDTRGFEVKINQQQKYVLFSNSGDGYDTDSTVSHLRNHIHKIVLIHKQIASIDRSIEQSDRYVQKLLQGEKNLPRAGGGGESDMMGMMGMGGMMGYH